MANILAPYATGNAIPGGLSSVEGVSAAMADRIARMVAAMPPEVAQRFRIISGFRSTERQAQVNPGVTHSRHTGTGEPGSGVAVDLANDPVVLNWINQNPQHGLGFPLKHMKNEQNHMEMLDDGGGRYAMAPAGYRSGLRRFGVAEANLPNEPVVTGDYGGGGNQQPAEEPGLDAEQLRALLAMQQGGGLAGRLGGPSSLSGALTQGMQPAPVQPQPILQPQQPTIFGGPLPISQRLT